MLRTEKVYRQGEYISYHSAREKHGKFICDQYMEVTEPKCYIAVKELRAKRFRDRYL